MSKRVEACRGLPIVNPIVLRGNAQTVSKRVEACRELAWRIFLGSGAGRAVSKRVEACRGLPRINLIVLQGNAQTVSKRVEACREWAPESRIYFWNRAGRNRDLPGWSTCVAVLQVIVCLRRAQPAHHGLLANKLKPLTLFLILGISGEPVEAGLPKIVHPDHDIT